MTDPYIEPEEQTSCYNSPDPAHCKKLPAEIKFDKAVYGGISYWAQAITGIALTKWLRHGSGRKYFDKIAGSVATNFIEKISSKRGVDAVKSADSWSTVTIMVGVGTTFLLPVKWLEDRKPEIVRWINKRTNKSRTDKGEVISDKELAYQEMHLEALDKAPKQSWLSLLLGRAAGLAVVYTALPLIGDNNKIMEDFSVDKVTKLVKGAGLKSVAQSKTFESYARISFYDLLYSCFSAGGLYVYSHFIHPKKPRNIEFPSEKNAPPPATDNAPVTNALESYKNKPLALGSPTASYAQKIAVESESPATSQAI